MALYDDNSSGMVMPVAPAYSNNGGFGNGFGGDWAWILLLLIIGGGWGGFGGGFGGWGGMGMMDGLYPWLNNSQNINGGFRDQMISGNINSIGDKVTSGFGDVQTALCGGFAGANATVNTVGNSLAQQMNANQLSALERSFAAQTANTAGLNNLSSQLASCCCENRAATQDVKYTIATEACATRSANAQNTQAILDKLCQLELDGYKRENDSLRSQLNISALRESQTAQTAQILAGQAAEIDGVYNRLKNCPVGTYSVCNLLTPAGFNCGCGCNG